MTITRASTVALALLEGARGGLAVHSVFASGVNLAAGPYLIFAGTGPDDGACALTVSGADVDALARSARWEWDGSALVSGRPRREIRLDGAVTVYPVTAPHVANPSPADPVRLRRARTGGASAAWFDSGVGLGLGLPRLRDAVAALVEDGPDAEQRVRAIVGLGIGLTPSADDALVGALCLLAAAGRTPDDLGRRLGEWLRGEGRGATTDVSASSLLLALDGAFSAALNGVVARLTDGTSDEDLDEAVRRLAAVGATSGSDAALGVQLAAEALAARLCHSTPARLRS